jgi:hypothetical protein
VLAFPGFQEPQDEIWLEPLPAIDDSAPNQDAAPRQLVLMPLRYPADSPQLAVRRLSTEDSDVAETQRLTSASPRSDLRRLSTDDSETAGTQWVTGESPQNRPSAVSREGLEGGGKLKLPGKSPPHDAANTDVGGRAEQQNAMGSSALTQGPRVVVSGGESGATEDKGLTDYAKTALVRTPSEGSEEGDSHRLAGRSAQSRLLRSSSGESDGEENQELT